MSSPIVWAIQDAAAEYRQRGEDKLAQRRHLIAIYCDVTADLQTRILKLESEIADDEAQATDAFRAARELAATERRHQ